MTTPPVGDQQHEHQVKGRELPQLALAEQPEADEEDHVDQGCTNDEVPPRNAQVEELTEITHVRRSFSVFPSPACGGGSGWGCISLPRSRGRVRVGA